MCVCVCTENTDVRINKVWCRGPQRIGLSVSGSMVIGEVLVKALAGFGRGLVSIFRRSCVRSLHTIHVTQNTQERERETASESERER
jgi:hypothetical protein